MDWENCHEPGHPDYVGRAYQCTCGERVRMYGDGLTDVVTCDLHTCLDRALATIQGRAYYHQGKLTIPEPPRPLPDATTLAGRPVTVTVQGVPAHLFALGFCATCNARLMYDPKQVEQRAYETTGTLHTCPGAHWGQGHYVFHQGVYIFLAPPRHNED